MQDDLATEVTALLMGLGNSLLISVIGIAIGIGIGVVLGAIRYARIPVASLVIVGFVNTFRCTPLLVQIFLLFYALPDIGISLTPFQTSWLALALWGGAYQTEVFRAAFDAVPKGEVTAARALGLPALQTFIDVTLPLALRIAITGATTTAITQFRSSSFMIVVGYQELTYVANRIVSDTFKVFETFGIACLMYLLVCSILSAVSRTFERRLAIPGLGVIK
ncbi:amino acid ABC transporter permease [Bradyrhizobium sp. CCGUVB1N3]|uniref:amino acid ABC transporter permease n=1 Tax=Bradyrhizobium sp. CCGUVB1N3 TaxID=2949629 RepID=UPI0020B36DDC|nr:amino acid ABC transporter permease [Bradyrhizobium sp. CCGUVB1N3]MCP3474851.1 amino acid ABC transporter permease [Bradyrhizobium sp. CCGUVB1N3]